MNIATEVERLERAKSDLKTAIINKGVEVSDTDTLDTYASKVDSISAGGDSFYDTFWDTFQNYGQGGTVNYQYAFANSKWKDNIYNPKYTIKPLVHSTGAIYIFYQNNAITDTKVDIDVSQCTECNYMFAYCSALVTIRKIISGETTKLYNAFAGCSALVNVTFEGIINTELSFKSSSKLSSSSVQSIIDCLADLTGGTVQTLTLHATVKANLTQDQLATITGKNWTLA